MPGMIAGWKPTLWPLYWGASPSPNSVGTVWLVLPRRPSTKASVVARRSSVSVLSSLFSRGSALGAKSALRLLSGTNLVSAEKLAELSGVHPIAWGA